MRDNILSNKLVIELANVNTNPCAWDRVMISFATCILTRLAFWNLCICSFISIPTFSFLFLHVNSFY